MRDKLIVGVYVDHLIVTGSRFENVKNFKNQIKEVFEMSDLGSLSTYLGIEIDQRPECICLSQRDMLVTFLKKEAF